MAKEARSAFSLAPLGRDVPARARTLTSVPGLRVGHAETADGSSGVTVVRFDQPTATVVDVRGGASATYDTASLAVDATFGRRWAIFFSGGSLFGLDAARGIRTRILEEGGGHRAFRNPTPIAPVSGAALFDLPARRGPLPEYLSLGYAAAEGASRAIVPFGRRGAGAGALVGKYLGRDRAMRGGVGSAAARVGGGTVGVLVAVNAVGAIRDPTDGRWVAGARGPRGRVVPPDRPFRRPERTTGTTLTLVATDLALDRPALARVAAIGHAGVGRAVVPYQSSTDGDIVFAATTDRTTPRTAMDRPGAAADLVGTCAADLAVAAILGAVRSSNRLG